MVGSIRGARHSVGPIGRRKVAWLFGTRVAEAILASGPPTASTGRPYGCKRSGQTVKKLLWHGGRPHMGPCFRRDDEIEDTPPHSRGTLLPESCQNDPPQRAWGMPGAQCTRSLACKVKSTRVSHHRSTGNHPAFPHAMVYGLYRALPGARLSDSHVLDSGCTYSID